MKTKAFTAKETKDINSAEVELEQVLEANRNITLVILVNLIMGSLALFVISQQPASQYIPFWLFFLVLSLSFRVLIRLNYKNIHIKNLERWKLVFIFSSLYSGIFWGVTGLMMGIGGNESQQAAIAFLLGGMAAGSVPTHSSIKWNYHAFILPLLVPLLYFVMDSATGDPMEFVKATMIVTYILIMTVFSIKFRRLQYEKTLALISAHELINKLHDSEQKMTELALHDVLTGLYNRASFNEKIMEEVSRFQRYNRSTAIMIIDIDHFKRVNDTYGHLVGDEVLKWVAKILESTVRSSDYIARYGGEEFVVICPEIELDAAVELSERVLDCFRHCHCIVSNGVKIDITVSIGLAMFRDGMAPKDITALADQNLYQAKALGRDQVVHNE